MIATKYNVVFSYKNDFFYILYVIYHLNNCVYSKYLFLVNMFGLKMDSCEIGWVGFLFKNENYSFLYTLPW